MEEWKKDGARRKYGCRGRTEEKWHKKQVRKKGGGGKWKWK